MDFIKPLLFLAFSYCALNVAASEIKTIKREWPMKDRKVAMLNPLGKCNYVPYGRCTNNGNFTDCEFWQENIVSDDIIQKDSCFTRFGSELMPVAEVDLLAADDRNQLYIITIEKSDDQADDLYTFNMTIRILNLLNCKYRDTKPIAVSFKDYLKKPTNWLFRSFITEMFSYDDDTIDLFSWFFTSCKGSLCKMTYDKNGEIMTEPSPIFNNQGYLYKLYPAKYASSPKEYFAMVDRTTLTANWLLLTFFKDSELILPRNYSKIDGVAAHLSYISADAKESELMSIKDDFSEDKLLSSFKYMGADNSRDMFSMCWLNSHMDYNTTVRCVSYDLNKNKIMDVSLNLTYSPTVIKVLNAANGGLYLLTGPTKTADIKILDIVNGKSRTLEKLYIKYISSKGLTGHTVELNGYSCTEDERNGLHIAMNEGRDMCVSILCEGDIIDEIPMKYERTCVPKDLIN